mmetsp:Transcript_62724/g.168089  ORF Transcript_62724/g.168089 Transcript_62724/m.168089 type:complete len:116 (-) Transcript_62724:83-430(-)
MFSFTVVLFVLTSTGFEGARAMLENSRPPVLNGLGRCKFMLGGSHSPVPVLNGLDRCKFMLEVSIPPVLKGLGRCKFKLLLLSSSRSHSFCGRESTATPRLDLDSIAAVATSTSH